ncbi:hypothetical protein M433DRAFT_151492 [Acidomyces richmondensis BFW]|nr:MAG: hypothetical protein FE78DRAFT_85413 [Acidomyces sp. 'richmondensis']KYG48065.1 hypothetical protein M433DRAFT_151492 [Acidomyces richmondensis BFW]
MSSSVPSLTSLLKQTSIDDHEEVLRAANTALKQNKNDLEAQRVKVVALLKLDRYDDAIQCFETAGNKLQEESRLEYSYALYKTGKPSEAAKIAQQGAGRGYEHVEAQARYRKEEFQRAAELYRKLEGKLEQDAEADLRINSCAVDAQLEWAGRGELVDKARSSSREDMESFEIMYNYACDSIAQGQLARAGVLLKRAKDLCVKSEDLTDEEKKAELLPITIQQVYVLTSQGKMEEAESLASTLDVSNVPDASTKYIAQVNTLAAKEEHMNPYLVQRLIDKDLSTLKPDYPFHFQNEILNWNKYASALQSMKYIGTAESTGEFISKQDSPNLNAYTNALSAINAAAHARNQTGKQALKQILPLLESRPKDVGLMLTVIQLYILTGNSGSAINLMESFLNRLEQSGNSAELDVRFAPGLVGAVVSLNQSAGRKGHVRTEFAKAASYWRRKLKNRPQGVPHMLKAAGRSLLESQDSVHRELAAEIFKDLHQRDDKDRYAAAGLLAASPESTTPTQMSSLQPIARLISGVDVDALESFGIAQPLSATNATASFSRKRPNEDIKSKKNKRMRKSRLPKDYDPNKKPDPERWLPLRDRSTYRPKGKKGKARQAMLSQGAAPPADSEGSRPGTPGGEVMKGKLQQGGGGKKKKGKGKR